MQFTVRDGRKGDIKSLLQYRLGRIPTAASYVRSSGCPILEHVLGLPPIRERACSVDVEISDRFLSDRQGGGWFWISEQPLIVSGRVYLSR